MYTIIYKQAAPPELGWRGHGSSTNRPLLRSSDGGGTVLLQTGRSSGARMEGARFSYKQAAPPELGWGGHAYPTNGRLLRIQEGGGTLLLQTVITFHPGLEQV